MTLPAEELYPERRAPRSRREAGHPIVGQSPAIVRALHLARQFAATEMSILLVGETGTGKELFAQSIHRWSGCAGEFVDINCGALPKEMVESLLFGHRRGAFTGAVEERKGLVAAANGGTLFLDELSSLPTEAQVKLLRVLETGEIRRVGDTAKQVVQFRIVAAVQEDLDARLASGDFRRDLFRRVAGVVLRLPTLRERPEDLWPLAAHFARGRGINLASEVRAVVEQYEWPDNVRELRLAVERAAHLTEGRVVGARAMAEAIELGAPPARTPPVPDERRVLEALLERNGGDVRLAAAELGVGRSTLYQRLHACGLRRRSPRFFL